MYCTSGWKLLTGMVVLLYCMLCSCSLRKLPITILSPNGRIKVQVTAWGGEKRNTLMYDVFFDNIPIVTKSPLGVLMKNGASFSEDLKVKGV